MSVLATSTQATETREEVIETDKANGKDGKESKDNYAENLARVFCIWYPITF